MECKIRDINVHYEEVGTGKPLLILHGLTLNGRSTMSNIEPLFEMRPGWRRIYPDLPGHGQTAIPAGMKHHDDILALVLEFIDAVAPGERFAVAGVSWGGYLARGVVHQRLKQIDGVLLDIPALDWGAPNSIRPAPQVLRHDPLFVNALQPGEEWLLNMAVVQSPELLEVARANWLSYMNPVDPALFAYLETPFTFDPDLLPAPCPAPTVFIMGRQDHVVGYRYAWGILDNYPRGTLAVLDGAGHLLDLEQPVLFRALVSEWLDRVEEYISQ